MNQSTELSTKTSTTLKTLIVAPSVVLRGENAISEAGEEISRFGNRPLVISGASTLDLINPLLQPVFQKYQLQSSQVSYNPDCSEQVLEYLNEKVVSHQADFIIGVGGGKALDTAKLVAHSHQLPIITIPTSAATCAAWTALSNIYSNEGAFQYDVPLKSAPNLLILDYNLVKTAPQRTLIAGIGDSIAKWYEASVSSGDSTSTMIIGAVQQARILRDILFQKSRAALSNPGGEEWQEVVDATILLTGVIGGLGGANCRTVGAHAVHNGLTHIKAAHHALHGEKVAYGILVQLRLEEMVQQNQLAATARQQLLTFYEDLGLPKDLADLGLKDITLDELSQAASISCNPKSDIHRLPFKVIPEQLMAAMVSTTLPVEKKELMAIDN